MNNARIWRWWLAFGMVAVVAYLVLPYDDASAYGYNTVGMISALAIVAGVRLHRPAQPAMWYLLAAGRFVSATGDITYGWHHVSDVCYLIGYGLTAAGLLVLVRHRRGSIGEFLDASIAALGLTMLFWVFVLHNGDPGVQLSVWQRVVSGTYFGTDLLMMALLARVLTDAASRTPSLRLVGSLTALVFATDTTYTLLTFQHARDNHVLSVLFLLTYVVWAACALHPSMAQTSKASRPVPGTTVGPGRLTLFAICSLFAPALLLIPRVAADPADRAFVVVASAALSLLAIVRMSGFVGRLRRIALSDELTGLANRRRFDQELAKAGDRRQVLFLGLNGFKNINDELGRQVGDQVLTLTARRIWRAVPAGSLVARLGGDEFAVLLPSADSFTGLIDALREPVEACGHELLVGVAIGAATSLDGNAVETLRRAEIAMHAAKRTGEPARFWSAELDENATAHARLGAEMRSALDNEQFRVVYQPIVDVQSGKVAAVEALVRWEHPVRGLISPVMFVPVAEQNGLIVELGEWVLRTSCHRLVAWRDTLGDDAPDRISVNVSARQLNRPGFACTVAAALADSGLPAACLTVEVTETAVFEGGQAVTALHELRALGVRIALDDFGTGHSSLGLLQTVPVDILKVDKSFVDHITEAGGHTVIAEALMHVSTGLGLSAVAEGVETAAQAEALRGFGYRLLQGYHFGRPVADPDFALVRATMSVVLAG